MSEFETASNEAIKSKETDDVNSLSTLAANITINSEDDKKVTPDIAASTENKDNVISVENKDNGNGSTDKTHHHHPKTIASLSARQTQHLSAGISFQDPSLKMYVKSCIADNHLLSTITCF